MRKKLGLLLTFVLALAVTLGVIAGCKKTEEVTVEISKTTLELVAGKSQTLTAAASDGSDLVWTTSDEAIATVNENGKVTGVKAGKATVTATVKDGEASASCEVTVKDPVKFVFKVGDEEKTEITVDRNVGPVQITATASEGTITSWSSSNEKIATVTNTGLVTGVHEGEVTITAQTATAAGSIKVTVTDSFDGVHYDIDTEDKTEAGNWFYYSNSLKGQAIVINQAEVRGDVITFDYEGNCNWDLGDVFLAVKTEVSEGWHKLNMNINSDVETVITVNGTRVNLVEGDNAVSVAYEQQEGASSVHIILGNADAQTVPKDIRLVITGVEWKNFTPVDLALPTFTCDGENNVEITDETNTEGVKQYEIGFFAEGSETPVHVQPLLSKSGKLDTTVIETNGEYILRIRVIGNPGFNNTGWSTGNDVKVTVNNTNISYDLNPGPDQNRGAGAATAVTSGRWEYYAVVEEGSTCSSASFSNGTVTYNGMVGWTWYGVQLFRHFSQFEAGTIVAVTLTIEATESGNVTIGGTVVELVKDTPKTVTVYVAQPSDNATPTLTIALSVKKAEENPSGNLPAEGALPTYTALTVKVSDVTASEYTPVQLDAPSVSIADKAVTITDNNEEGRVSGYEVGFFTAAGGDTPVKTVTVKTAEDLNSVKVDAGEYTLKVRAVPASVLYSKSEWSTGAAFTPERLSAPTLAVEEKVVTITDETNETANVGGYQLGWFLADEATPKYTMTVKSGEAFDDGKVEAGSYTLKLRALSSNLWYSASEWSEGVAYEKTGGIVMNTYEANWNDYTTGQNEAATGNDKWSLWYVESTEWHCGSVVSATHKIDEDTKTLEVTFSGGDNNWSVQLFYKNSQLTNGQKYKVTLDINASAACTVTINGTEKALVAGDNSIEIEWTAANATSFSMQMGQQNSTEYTLKIANVAWTEV